MYDGPDESHSGLSHEMACPLCDHPAHFYTRCGWLLDAVALDVVCPCNRVPVPGALPLTAKAP